MILLSARSPAGLWRWSSHSWHSPVLLGLPVPSSTRTAFVQRFTQPVASSGSDQEHYVLAHIGESALKGHPIGLGYGNFPRLPTKAPETIAQLDQAFFHSHRLPVQVGLDAGWLGLAGLTLLAILPLVAAGRTAHRKRLTPTAAGFAGAFVAFLAQGWYDYLFDEISFLVIFVRTRLGDMARLTTSRSSDGEGADHLA